MNKNSKIYLAGSDGLVGSSLLRRLKYQGYTNILGSTRRELNLVNQQDVLDYFKKNKPEYVFVVAAKVGGIGVSSVYPADFIYNNLMIQANVINAAHVFKVKKLLSIGSYCLYPKNAKQPMKETSILTGEFEPSNKYYAIGKIAGLTMVEAYRKQCGDNFIFCMPTSLYGINDNYSPMSAHVIPAMIRKIHEAKVDMRPTCLMWGTGKPKREFLYSDDFADACILLMDKYNSSDIINIGSGVETTIKDLALTIGGVVGYEGRFVFDPEHPDGSKRRLVDSSSIHKLGWKAKVPLKKGIEIAYKDFLTGKVRT